MECRFDRCHQEVRIAHANTLVAWLQRKIGASCDGSWAALEVVTTSTCISTDLHIDFKTRKRAGQEGRNRSTVQLVLAGFGNAQNAGSDSSSYFRCWLLAATSEQPVKDLFVNDVPSFDGSLLLLFLRFNLPVMTGCRAAFLSVIRRCDRLSGDIPLVQ